MSCKASPTCKVPPKLLTYYTNKVNIYDNPNYIKLPNYVTCPPPPLYYYPYPYPYSYPYSSYDQQAYQQMYQQQSYPSHDQQAYQQIYQQQSYQQPYYPQVETSAGCTQCG